MSDMSPPRDLGGYYVSHATDTFEVNVHDLQFSRRWGQGGSLGDKKPKFKTIIYGRAVAERGDVRIFDKAARSNEFSFTLHSDADAETLWKTVGGADLLVRQTLAPEQSRIRDLQHAEFDKLPPTAYLFRQPGGWSLECRVPLSVLDELSADLEARLVEKLWVRIQWPFGFKVNSSTWCFFDGGQLIGYVAWFDWSSTAPKVIQQNDEENKTNKVSLAIKETAASINKNLRKLIGLVAVIAGLIVIGLLFLK
jgi:hypothetical protein